MALRNKASLTTQTKKIWLVIRKNKPIDEHAFEEWLKVNTSKYAYIKHSEDVDPITGEFIPVHYHAVFDIIKAKSPLSTTLNSISNALGFTDNNGVEIDKYVSFVACLQYLIHKNNPEKTQHKIDEIITNIPSDELTTYMTLDSEMQFTFDFIYSLVNRVDDPIQLLREIPPKMFKENYRYIAVIWNYIHFGKMEL